MGRVNLKEVKEALNKLPDENLEHFYVTHKMSLEDSDVSMGLVFFDDEENWDNHRKIFEKPEFKVLQEFVDAIADDCKKVAICLIDEDKVDDYADDSE